jgi:hypothetical protein
MSHLFWINQSLIKEFFNKWGEKEHCPHRIYRTRILKEFDEDTESMMKGRYFETQCLGKTAYGQLDDLPRKKNGEKTADHKRIDDAIMLFRKVARDRMLSLNEYNVQVELRMQLNSEFGLKGNLDIFPTTFIEDNQLTVALIDLKLTMDITSEWGDFCWGKPQSLDTTQLICYSTLVRHLSNPYNDFQNYPDIILDYADRGLVRAFYWVFGYRKEGFLPLEVVEDEMKMADFKESLRRTMSFINMYEKQNWPKMPGKVCHKCPVMDCEMRNKTLKL